jgi:hypothetical protein
MAVVTAAAGMAATNGLKKGDQDADRRHGGARVIEPRLVLPVEHCS